MMGNGWQKKKEEVMVLGILPIPLFKQQMEAAPVTLLTQEHLQLLLKDF